MVLLLPRLAHLAHQMLGRWPEPGPVVAEQLRNFGFRGWANRRQQMELCGKPMHGSVLLVCLTCRNWRDGVLLWSYCGPIVVPFLADCPTAPRKSVFPSRQFINGVIAIILTPTSPLKCLSFSSSVNLSSRSHAHLQHAPNDQPTRSPNLYLP